MTLLPLPNAIDSTGMQSCHQACCQVAVSWTPRHAAAAVAHLVYLLLGIHVAGKVIC